MGWARVAVFLLVAGLACGCATRAPQSMPAPGTMPEAQVPAPAPAGFLSFCMRFAGQCDTAPSTAPAVVLNGETWQTLLRVNRSINDSIWPQDDEVHYGRAEFWTIPSDGYGDCDDYAVTKRKSLIEAGFPAAALRLAVVTTPDALRHAVLTVATDKGDLVLDNLNDNVMAWNATGFTWIERQDSTNPMNWASFERSAGSNTPTAGLNPPK